MGAAAFVSTIQHVLATGIDGSIMEETVAESVSKAIIDLIKKIRVLHVDDDSGVLKITKECLESDASVQVETAVSVEEALQKLEKEKFDIIVSDYQMPGKDGLDLLKTLRNSGNTIPFIMFTGKGREEVAIRALNMGANQYLNKVGETETVYAELAHSVAELAKTGKAEEKQCELEQKFRVLFEKTTDGLVYCDPAGRILDVNEKAAEIAGKRREDIIGRSFLDLGLVSSENVPVLVERLKKQTSEPIGRFDFEIQRENGEKRFIEISFALIQENNTPTGSLAIIRDITERKKTEEMLKEKEERYAVLSAASFEAIGICEQGKIVDANNQLSRMLGYELTELVGMNVLDFVAPESRDLVNENMRKGIEGPYEHLALRKDGSVFPVRVRARPIRYKGRIARVTAIRDITEDKKLEKSLEENEEKFAGLFSGNPEATVFIDPSMNIVEVNPRFMSLFGYEQEEVKGKCLNDLIVPKNLAEEGRMLDSKAKEGYVYHETVRKRKDGSPIPVSVSAAPISFHGQLIGYVGVYKDVSEQKRAFAQFRGLFTGNPEAAAYLGPDFHILDVNPRFEELFGYSLEEIKGKHINEVVVPSDMLEEGKLLDQRAGRGYVYHDTVRKRKDGQLVPVSVSAAPIVVEGSLVGHVAMYTDISELKMAVAAMKEMMQKTILTNEKLRVVGGLTRHDVRNKLSTVLGNTYLLRKQLASDAGVMDKLKDMEEAVHQVTQIFEFAKDYESLGVEELVYVDVDKTVEKAIGLFADLKHAIIVNNCAGLTVLADSLLKRMFYNLIDNSLKHGQDTSRIEIRYQETNPNELKLYYEDDGGGIHEETKPNLFKEGFTTGNGTGYGLYLIKKMMEVYGWTITETGTPGKGAQFTITIPRMNKNGKENYQIAPHG